ncbi:MAG: sensor histidine kinase protein [Candidatus Acidoferrum typicum]|nr:sensor histidine kinase protein [Candidatus Acidoferrum typicum]
MRLHTATGLTRWVKSAEAKTLQAGRLNIGPRLILGFAVIIFLMLVADAVLLWQFHLVRAEAERLNGIDRKLVAVLRVHTSLSAFHDRLEALVDSQDAAGLVTEAGPLRNAVLEDSRRAMSALSLAPFDLQRDPTILPTLHAVQSALPSQLEAITTLAASGDWRAVRLRLANQVTSLKSLTSALVETVDHEVGEEQAQTVRNIKRVQRLVFLVVPLTALFTLLIAATLGLAITRSITQPLARLVDGSKALARGEFQYEVTVTGRDELAHLGRVFNDTASRLQDLYATLQQSEDRLRLVIDTIPAHVWSTRPDGSVDFVNRRWLETTGLTIEDALRWNWGSVVHPDDLARYLDEWRAALAAGDPTESEVRLRRADGNYRWWLVRNVPLRNDAGNIVKWYGTAIDIEERKCAEEALRETQANLARVSRVTTMGELTASLAHEIRQPIAAALTDATTCLRWLGRDQPDVPEAREAAARIIKDVTRATEIISRIRVLFQNVTPQQESLDVNEVIEGMIPLLRSEASRHSISIRSDLADDLPKISADHVQLQQVFMNLMLNGIEAMVDRDPPGKLVVKSQRAEDGQILISISDTGAGLSAEQADQIFDAFFTTKPHGTGMGLPISRSIIESHGGRLWAAENFPCGATFSFTLPTKVDANQ